ncbi:MAG: CBS domain-containing protein [Deltaproteobacteria bacterium]|nr:CBS domain-containing protein [Deltaproteobacteria bacterium]MBW2154316.1 CBS domain-containing protein [Deltaproteobacteria bacterium]
MFINRSMTARVVTIDKDASVLKAKEIMKTHEIRHLPVVDKDNRLIGIVTERDIRSAMPSIALQDQESEEAKKLIAKIRIEDIMTKNPITVSPTYTLQDALLLIQKTRVGAFPVVDDRGILKGIISIRDLIRAFINVLGIGEPGTLLCILVEEKVGQLKKIVDAVTEENISFGSVLVARYWDEGKRAVFPYLLTQNVGPIKRKLEKLGFELLDPMEWYLDQLPKTG